LIKTLSGHGSFVLGLGISPDNKHFASCSSDKTVKIWEISSFENVNTFTEHKDQVFGVSYNEKGDLLASIGDDNSLKIYSCPL